MKASGLIGGFIALAAIGVAILQWNATQKLRAENDTLRAQLEMTITPAPASDAAEREAELQALRKEAQELVRLRGEVTQLRGAAREADKLRAQVQQLQAENQQSRASAASATAAARPAVTSDTFHRDSWTFAGYGSPESALVSAIWAMREGNPKTYLDSLAPEEQARMSQAWAGKNEGDVAAKHQNDVSKITSIRVVDRHEVSPDQVMMSIYIGGVDRLEKVSMQRVGTDWKFGGFVREAKK